MLLKMHLKHCLPAYLTVQVLPAYKRLISYQSAVDSVAERIPQEKIHHLLLHLQELKDDAQTQD